MEIIWKIDPWLNNGMNSDTERTSGCYYCHGTVLKTEDGELTPDCWPNVGVGRVNLDGSLGSCTSCHTRHRFSIMEAESLKPAASATWSGPSPDRNLHRVQTRRYLCRIRG
ncbi:MAG: hypothetical protein R2874_06750 [Desulfobacterales bacterium]